MELVAVAVGLEEDRSVGAHGDRPHGVVGERRQLLRPARAVERRGPEVELTGDVRDEEQAVAPGRELRDRKEAPEGEELLEGRKRGLGLGGGCHEDAAYNETAAEPSMSALRSRARASFVSSSGNTSTCVFTGIRGARARNSTPSSRVRFATERRTRSSQRSSYGKPGMSDMWMPAQTIVPPLAVARSAFGTSVPTGAKMIAPSSSSGGGSSDQPAHSQPSSSANARPSSSPWRTKPNSRRPSWRATCAMMWADAPKPYSPRRSASPARRSDR